MSRWSLCVWLAVWLALPVGAETLSLHSVLQQALRHHPKVRAASLNRDLARAKILEKEGAFDPALVLGTEWLRYQSSTDPGKPKAAFDNQLSYQIQDPYGWKLSAGYRLNTGQVKSPDSLTGGGGEYFLEFKLPLLRGAGTNPKQTALEQARWGEALMDAYWQAVRLDVMQASALAYYDWVAAVNGRTLVAENLRLAEERAEQVRIRAEAGDLAPIAAVEAEQEVLRRRESLAKADRDVEKTGLKLNFYLWNSDGQPAPVPSLGQAPGWLAQAVPSPPPAEDLGHAELLALRNRPELMTLSLEQRVVALDRRLAENERLPILDLTLGPGYDTGNKSIGLTWKAGLQLLIPLATRTADGQLKAAEIKLDKLEIEQVLELQRVLLEVRDADSAIRGAARRWESAQMAWELARRLEQAERLKFELGDSTLFLVNQRERQTLSEALKLLDTILEHNRGLIRLEAASGRLIDL